MRIISGKYKYRILKLPKKLKFSPILSSVRENIFNTLHFKLNWKETVVADVFSGSGILGIESLSRNAKFCHFNDLNYFNTKTLKANLDRFKISNFALTNLTYEQFINQCFQSQLKLDLVFVAPPYQNPEYATKALKMLLNNKLLNLNAWVIVQLDQDFEFNDANLLLAKKQKYGRTRVFYYHFNDQKNPQQPKLNFHNQKLIIFSGPSGVGKKSILQSLLKISDLNLGYSISCTTRKKRATEINHRDYHFMTKKAFENDIRQNHFLEYAKYLDHYYGTLISHVQRLFDQAKNVLVEVEIQGAQAIKKLFPQAVWIFVFPPNIKELELRLKNRSSETETEIAKRLKITTQELKTVITQNICDFYIENSNLSESIIQITKFLRKIFAKK